MTAQNAEIIRRGYDAFARADLPAVFEMLDTEITWHVPVALSVSRATGLSWRNDTCLVNSSSRLLLS